MAEQISELGRLHHHTHSALPPDLTALAGNRVVVTVRLKETP